MGRPKRGICRLKKTKEFWLRGVDLNHRPLGYEPNELPDCSTPRFDDNNRVRHRQTPRRESGEEFTSHYIILRRSWKKARSRCQEAFAVVAKRTSVTHTFRRAPRALPGIRHPRSFHRSSPDCAPPRATAVRPTIVPVRLHRGG